jgi:hypothetical protein
LEGRSLCCELFPEDHVIERKEGIMEGMRSRQATIDDGHMMQENSQGIVKEIKEKSCERFFIIKPN